MQKSTLVLIIISLCFATSACQPRSEPLKPDPIAIDTQQSSEIPVTALEPKVIKGTTVNAQTCLALNQTMQKVDNNSKIEAIYAIQEQLKACLPTANNAEVITLLKSYQDMYDQFLSASDNEDISYQNDEQFYEVMTKLDENKKVPTEQLAKLTPRLRYLVELIEDDANIDVLYLGEGDYEFNHNLQAMADIFTPYLRKDQSKFTQRLAKDNQGIFWFDAGIAVSLTEIVERALFWEDYIERYPNGYAIADAKQLFTIYRYVLFFGSENTQWIEDDGRKFYNAEDAKAIHQLAKRPDSILAQDAKKLLKFMVISDYEREQTYPVPEVDSNGSEIQDWAKSHYRLEQALSILSPWQENYFKDCFSSVTCIDYSPE